MSSVACQVSSDKGRGIPGGLGWNGLEAKATVNFGLRRLGAAFGLGDMSPSFKARTCPRTPNNGVQPSGCWLLTSEFRPCLHPGKIIAWVSNSGRGGWRPIGVFTCRHV